MVWNRLWVKHVSINLLLKLYLKSMLNTLPKIWVSLVWDDKQTKNPLSMFYLLSNSPEKLMHVQNPNSCSSSEISGLLEELDHRFTHQYKNFRQGKILVWKSWYQTGAVQNQTQLFQIKEDEMRWELKFMWHPIILRRGQTLEWQYRLLVRILLENRAGPKVAG